MIIWTQKPIKNEFKFLFFPNKADAWTVSFAPDGKNIASGSYTGKVNVFNIDSGKKETNFQTDEKGKFTMSVSYVKNNF